MPDPPQLPALHASGGWAGLTSLPLNFWKAGQRPEPIWNKGKVQGNQSVSVHTQVF